MTVHGMYHEQTIEIDAAPEAVYDLVSDLGRMGEWSPENRGGEWLDGGRGRTGDRFEGHNKIGDREWSVVCQVVSAERPTEFEFVTGEPDAPFVRWSYRLSGSGPTTLTEVWNVEQLPPSLATRTPEQLAERAEAVRASMAQTLAGIKASAEGA
ncbi:MAG: SRPBCC family protein [Actinomycetota bacterium]